MSLCVPSSKFNLLSVSKLTQDEQCFVAFYPNFCLIQDSVTRVLKGVGREKGGLYYLVDEDTKHLDVSFLDKPLHAKDEPCVATGLVNQLSRNIIESKKCVIDSGEGEVNKSTLWHLRLGCVPMDKLKYIANIQQKDNDNVCITCRMSKMF